MDVNEYLRMLDESCAEFSRRLEELQGGSQAEQLAALKIGAIFQELLKDKETIKLLLSGENKPALPDEQTKE